MTDFIEQANSELADTEEAPLSLDEYVELVLENPRYASQSSKYLLEAIEHYGTRAVVEEGEEKERYVFFDDPCGDGEHAVLGNTDILNEFVDDLRRMASDEGDNESIVWFGGPTATGKSELKRCLVSGLRGYSKTDSGKRFTMEWNIATLSGGDGGMTYGGSPVGAEQEWYRSPVNSHPLTVFPEATRTTLLDDINDGSPLPVEVSGRLDPFCQVARDTLKKAYVGEEGDLFSAITDPKHFQVVRQTVDVGDGIGILHSEDNGSPKERLVGGWMAPVLKELSSRGEKNPQAFSYDGVLSQGNGLLTLVEDASQHADLLQKLLNIPEERMVKLDKKIPMDIDTVMVILSNPDLDAKLNQHADSIEADPLKALRRRLDKYEFRYLTNLSSEVELLHREFAGKRCVWDDVDAHERVPSPVTVHDTEFSPHALEAAAMYNIVTRLSDDDLPRGFDLIDKALLFERGYHEEGNERTDISEYDLDADAGDGTMGIPVTYTKGVLGAIAQDEDLVLPHDVLDAMVEDLEADPVFSPAEADEFGNRVNNVRDYVWEQQEADVIEAILRDRTVDEDTIETYVEDVYAWDDADTDTPEDDEFDPLKMKVFETEHLGLFDADADYTNTDIPMKDVKQFRKERIITALNSFVWKQRGGDFTVDDLPLTEVPLLKSLLGTNDWDAVLGAYENFDPDQWRDPPSGTETEEVKEQTIQNMVEMFDYSEESALQTTIRVFDHLTLESDDEGGDTKIVKED